MLLCPYGHPPGYRKWYFRSGGRANSLRGDGSLGPDMPRGVETDSFVYDPDNPVPSTPDSVFFTPMDFGPSDQRGVEEREDVLVYTSPVLDRDMEVTGPVSVILHAASSAVNTDFAAKLCDVYPDGRSMRLCDGIIRASFRESDEYQKLIEPEKIYEYRIDLAATSNMFRKGHRVRVEITSSNFPQFDRNLNTGGDPATETKWVKANQTVHHTRKYPSCIVLPVIK